MSLFSIFGESILASSFEGRVGILVADLVLYGGLQGALASRGM